MATKNHYDALHENIDEQERIELGLTHKEYRRMKGGKMRLFSSIVFLIMLLIIIVETIILIKIGSSLNVIAYLRF